MVNTPELEQPKGTYRESDLLTCPEQVEDSYESRTADLFVKHRNFW